MGAISVWGLMMGCLVQVPDLNATSQPGPGGFPPTGAKTREAGLALGAQPKKPGWTLLAHELV